MIGIKISPKEIASSHLCFHAQYVFRQLKNLSDLYPTGLVLMAAPHMIWAHSIVSFSLTNLSYPFLVGVKLRSEKTRGDDPIYSYQPLNTHGAMKTLHFFLRFPLLSAAFTA
jgi:hypothetical protein